MRARCRTHFRRRPCPTTLPPASSRLAVSPPLAVATSPLVVPQLHTPSSRVRRVRLFAVGVLFPSSPPSVIMYAFAPAAGVAALRPSVVRLGRARPAGSSRCRILFFWWWGGVRLVCGCKPSGTRVASPPRVGMGIVLTSSLLADGWPPCACNLLNGVICPQAAVSQRSFTGAKAQVAVRARRARVTPYVCPRMQPTSLFCVVLGVAQSSGAREWTTRDSHVPLLAVGPGIPSRYAGRQPLLFWAYSLTTLRLFSAVMLCVSSLLPPVGTRFLVCCIMQSPTGRRRSSRRRLCPCRHRCCWRTA